MKFKEFSTSVDNILQGLTSLGIKFNAYSTNCTTMKIIFYNKRQQKLVDKHEKKIVELLRKESEYVEISYKKERILRYKIDYAENYEDLKYYLVCDVLEYMMVGVEKTIKQVEKEYYED